MPEYAQNGEPTTAPPPKMTSGDESSDFTSGDDDSHGSSDWTDSEVEEEVIIDVFSLPLSLASSISLLTLLSDTRITASKEIKVKVLVV